MEIFRVVIVDETKADICEPANSKPQPISLSPQQQLQLDSTLSKFPSVFTDKPGITKAITHSIKLSCTTPLWTPSYTGSLAHREAFRQEIDTLFELGIIEVPHSLWSSPPIRKRMAAYVLCVISGGLRVLGQRPRNYSQ